MVGIELIGHCLGRCRCQQADNNDGKQTEHKARHDLIQIEDAAGQLRPYQIDYAADDNAGIRALLVRLQNSEHRTSGPKAEPKPPHA